MGDTGVSGRPDRLDESGRCIYCADVDCVDPGCVRTYTDTRWVAVEDPAPEKLNEGEARLLLLGREALSITEQDLLTRLLALPGRSASEFARLAGLEVGSRAFARLLRDWRESGLLELDYDTGTPVYRATDLAVLVMDLDEVEWVTRTRSEVGPVDLDGFAEDYALAGGEVAA